MISNAVKEAAKTCWFWKKHIQVHNVKTVPNILSSTGVIPSTLHASLCALDIGTPIPLIKTLWKKTLCLKPNTYIPVQKTAQVKFC